MTTQADSHLKGCELSTFVPIWTSFDGPIPDRKNQREGTSACNEPKRKLHSDQIANEKRRAIDREQAKSRKINVTDAATNSIHRGTCLIAC